MEYTSAQLKLFAHRRDEFGSTADLLLEYLCDPALDTPTEAREEDFNGLDYLEQLETLGGKLYEPLSALDQPRYERLGRFERSWREFNASLPFVDAEFRWMLENSHGLWSTDSAQEMLQKLDGREATIVVTGVYRAVGAHELTERWVSWRRKSGAFERSGSLDVARQNLRNLRGVLTINGVA